MYKVVVTGGLCCGKNTVGQEFSKLGVTVIDADDIAKELVEPNSPHLSTIKKRYGGIVVHEGKLIRAALSDIVFNDEKERQWLEQLLHPDIIHIMQTRSDAAKSAYCLLLVPLLVEKNLQYLADRILLVKADKTQQVNRAMARDNTSELKINRILASQLPTAELSKYADDILDNSKNLQDLKLGIEKLHMDYLLRSHKHNTN